jgi:3-oxoacyl-[acyl-carrier protein] reductase
MDPPIRRSALITGVSRQAGIGAAIARALARDGANVFITYYRPYDRAVGLPGDPDEPQKLLDDLRAWNIRAEGLELDLSDPKAPKELFDCAEVRCGQISILVNNATCSLRDGIENLSPEHIDKHYVINVRAMALLCAEFVRRFRAIRAEGVHGRIINLSSGQGLAPMPGELAYAATKGAVDAFTRSLSAAIASVGITVNAVDPGATDTGWIPAELKAKWKVESPMGRIGSPEDAARIVRFLASPEAQWINGQVIHSRGGA